MRAATAEEVLEVVGLHGTTGSRASAGAALSNTYALLESFLETQLAEGEAVDYFSVSTFDFTKGVVRLRLTNRFVTGVVVRASSDGTRLMSTTAGEIVDDADIQVDTEAGIVTVYGGFTTGPRRLSVSYAFGGAVTDDTVAVPGWVKDAAVSLAVVYLNTYPSNPGNRKQATVGTVADVLYALLRERIGNKARDRATVSWPEMYQLIPPTP